MKTYRLILLSLIALAFTSCDDGLDKDISIAGVTVTQNENVVSDGLTLNVKKGEPIEFVFSGDPDNIVFFSGEEGSNFEYRNRTTIDPSQIVSSTLSVDVNTQWSGGYDNLFSMYMSESFTGLFKNDFQQDCQLLKDFSEWGEWVEQEEIPDAPNVTRHFEKDMKPYLSKNLTLAINVHPHDETKQQPRLNFNNLKITNVLDNGSTVVLYASEFGLTPVNIWSSDLSNITLDPNLSKVSGYYDASGKLVESALWYGTVNLNIWGMWNLVNASKGNLFVHSVPVGKGLRESWLVSDYLVINSCIPDKGITIKNISNNITSYKFTYEHEGTYSATFLMTNSNYKNEDSKVITMVVNVK